MGIGEGGACSQCGSHSFQSATWVEGQGTVCAKCLPRPPRRRHHDEDEDDGVVQPVVALSVVHGNGQARRLTREEVERAYPGRVSPDYGEAR
jgi:hypothetical protein